MKTRRVSAIVGLLGAVVFVGERFPTDRMKCSMVRAQLSSLEKALDHYYRENGYYPTSDQGLQWPFLNDSSDIDPGILKGMPVPHRIQTPLVDPWGYPYFYQSDGNAYVLKSLGTNNQRCW
jgi:general secretion pathway protein G